MLGQVASITFGLPVLTEELLSLEQKDEFVYWASFNKFRKTVADHTPIPSPANAAIG